MLVFLDVNLRKKKGSFLTSEKILKEVYGIEDLKMSCWRTCAYIVILYFKISGLEEKLAGKRSSILCKFFGPVADDSSAEGSAVKLGMLGMVSQEMFFE